VVETNATEDQFRSLFRLDEPVDIERIRSIGPELSPYIDGLPGLTVMRPSDAVEETVCFLCTANNHLSRITKMVQTLASYGEEMGQDLYIFPSIGRIASLSESELRAKGFGYRGRTIPEIARQMIERGGQEWLLGLREKPYEEAHRSLVEIKGIGPKLADCICLFALHHTEAVPVDTHLWQAAVRHYFPEWKGKSLTESRYRAIGDSFRDRFGKLAGFAHQYLFYDNMRNWRAYRKG
jgi:N-glycosylase/DNA lyase